MVVNDFNLTLDFMLYDYKLYKFYSVRESKLNTYSVFRFYIMDYKFRYMDS